MLSVKEAEIMREERSTARGELRDLEVAGKPSKLGRAEVMKYNARVAELKAVIEQLDVQLRDAPPPPMSPEDSWRHIVQVFDGITRSAEKARTKFMDEAATSLKYATEWYIADALQSEAQIRAIDWFLRLNNTESPNHAGIIERFQEMYPEFLRRLQEGILSRARGMASRSTSTASNFAEDMAAEGLARLYYEFTDSSAHWQINRALDAYTSWKELQNDKS